MPRPIAESITLSWKISLALMLSAALILLPDLAVAAGPFEDVLCSIVAWFTTPAGNALATLGVTMVGVGALLGKVSWGMAMLVGIGVAMMFGAANIVDALSGGAASDCS